MAGRITGTLGILLSLAAIGVAYQMGRAHEARLASVEDQLKRTMPRESLAPAQKTDAEKMLAMAQAGYDAFVRLGNARPGRPDLIELQITWSRKILDAQLLLHPTGPDRKKAFESHRDRVAALAAKTHLIHDATNAALAQVDHAVAEAEYLLASDE
jgi:hypothetical protein